MTVIYLSGVSTFAGLGALFVFFPLNAIFGRWTNLRRAIKYKVQDSRLKMMNELLNGIRVSAFFSVYTYFSHENSK